MTTNNTRNTDNILHLSISSLYITFSILRFSIGTNWTKNFVFRKFEYNQKISFEVYRSFWKQYFEQSKSVLSFQD